MLYKYYYCNYVIEVPFLCPMLKQAPCDVIPDIFVTENNLPKRLISPIVQYQNWEAEPGRFLLRGGRRAGRFLVENGQVQLQRGIAAEDEHLCAHFLATVIVALMRQRGLLVLHANVVLTHFGAVAISGVSGAGKSTTQAALMLRGCKMVTEDVTVLKLGDDGKIYVLPGVAKMNLCEDAAIKLGYNTDELQKNPLRRGKVFVPVEYSDIVQFPVCLKALYILNKYEDKNITLKKLTGAEKIIGLQESIYGPLFSEEQHNMFTSIKAFAEQVDIIKLFRPERGCSLDRVVEVILRG